MGNEMSGEDGGRPPSPPPPHIDLPLREFTLEELRELVADIDASDWEWDIGTIKLGDAPAHATYLIGKPKTRA